MLWEMVMPEREMVKVGATGMNGLIHSNPFLIPRVAEIGLNIFIFWLLFWKEQSLENIFKNDFHQKNKIF